MNPELGIIDKGKIEAVRVLNDVEYGEYKKAVETLLRFSSDLQLFLVAHLNYHDFQNLLKRYLKEYVEDPSMDWSRMERMALNTNRLILNFLSSVRTFLDHSETKLKRLYGRDSQRVKRFKGACSSAYDNHFSYRFLYKLRDYTQHCGMPLGKLALQSKAVGPKPKDVAHFLTVKFNRDELLREFGKKWGSQLKKEIQELTSEFEINPHIAEMMKCLERINLTLIEDDFPELIKSARYIKQLIAPMKAMSGVPCILRIKDLTGKRAQLNVEIEWIPLHLVEIVMNIEEKLQRS